MRFVHCLISIIVALAAAPSLRAQVSPHVTADQAAKLQVPQPVVDISSPVTVTAAFDPPTAGVGQSVYYRVAIDGAGEAAVRWPGSISTPRELKFGPVTQGQLMEFLGNSFRPLASFLYEVKPAAAGHFTVPGFMVMVDGQPVQIPAATVDVDPSVSGPPPRRLMLEVSATNVFLGQPLRARVLLPASPQNQIEALREVEFNGAGFMSDLSTVRQTVEMTGINGRSVPAYIYEITLTPIETGPSMLSAQAFAAGHEFFGTTITARVSIQGGPPHYVFLDSNPVQVNVRPLPAGQPASFNGSIGTFTLTAPKLSTNRIQVGEPVRLTVAVRGTFDRLVPPAPPNASDWEIVPDNPPDFSFTLIPLSDTVRQTPAIPFSTFDPSNSSYVDLTIPSLPVAVTSEALPTEMPAVVDAGTAQGPPLKLGALSPSPGRSAAGLVPPQLRGGFVCLQIVPILAILGLWQWDRHRRFLEAHPEIVRRREARRVLRREKRRLRDATRRGDAAAIVRHAANAMKIASAPRYAAHPQALVCSDVLNHLDDADRSGAAGETVRKIFAAADTRFAAAPQMQADLAALQPDLDAVLLKLEEQL
ncbi:MAG TPA: hypothetical protein VMF08_17650 [Candidatus Sulfotelmatobacter sp.]|nr:hypothetical protein [Candidatus Sulfotelmatobacter sp.]